MLKVENADVWGFEHAIRGCRNPKNSWAKSDSDTCIICLDCKADPWCYGEYKPEGEFVIGPNDMKLMQTLIKSGSEHRKFMRQVFCSADFLAPLYWWKEADQYKIGTTTDGCSTMHKIAAKEFTLDDFSHEHLKPHALDVLTGTIRTLNKYRDDYLKSKDKDDWWQLIQLLPSSYNQKRTWTGSYENLLSMYRQRKNHKLDEWHQFCDWVATLPYAKELIMIGDSDDSTHQKS